MKCNRRSVLGAAATVAVLAPSTWAGAEPVASTLTDVRSGASVRDLEAYRDRPFAALLRDCYLDERIGELVFRGLMEHHQMKARDQGIMALLEVVERNMSDHLERILRRFDVSFDAQPFRQRAMREAHGFLEAIGQEPWQALNEKLEHATQDFGVKYRVLAEKAPAVDRQMMAIFVRHEDAYATLAVEEQHGGDSRGRGLQQVWSILADAQRLAAAY